MLPVGLASFHQDKSYLVRSVNCIRCSTAQKTALRVLAYHEFPTAYRLQSFILDLPFLYFVLIILS